MHKNFIHILEEAKGIMKLLTVKAILMTDCHYIVIIDFSNVNSIYNK